MNNNNSIVSEFIQKLVLKKEAIDAIVLNMEKW